MTKVLVVEDETRVAMAIKRQLEARGFAVQTASESETALKLVLKAGYDLLILDRMLPGPYNGIEIANRARANKIDAPILMLTALGEVANRIEGLNAGADDYLIKPFSMKELEARVRGLLRRPKQRIDSILKADDLEMNTLTFEVRRSGKPIRLSTREYKLLHYLMYNKGKIISKDQIITHVWDIDSIIMPNTIEVYVGYLRKKIDKAFPERPRLIHTEFGFGYRLGDKP